jgi:hypothetical protein
MSTTNAPRRLVPLTLPADPGAVKITPEQFRHYLGAGVADSRGTLETYGPWRLPVRYKAPAVSYSWGPHNRLESVTLYGPRTLNALRESGYCLEGRCSIAGHTRRGMTGAQLWELPDGTLIETAVIHVCAPTA